MYANYLCLQLQGEDVVVSPLDGDTLQQSMYPLFEYSIQQLELDYHKYNSRRRNNDDYGDENESGTRRIARHKRLSLFPVSTWIVSIIAQKTPWRFSPRKIVKKEVKE